MTSRPVGPSPTPQTVTRGRQVASPVSAAATPTHHITGRARGSIGVFAGLALVGAILGSGCSFPPGDAAPRWGDHEIVVQCSKFKPAREAQDTSAIGDLSDVGPAALGMVSTFLGGDPLVSVIAVVAGDVARRLIERASDAEGETQNIRVPVPAGAPSCTLRRADGSVIILVGQATATAFEDGLPEGLSADDAALWRRLMGASGGPDGPSLPR